MAIVNFRSSSFMLSTSLCFPTHFFAASPATSLAAFSTSKTAHTIHPEPFIIYLPLKLKSCASVLEIGKPTYSSDGAITIRARKSLESLYCEHRNRRLTQSSNDPTSKLPQCSEMSNVDTLPEILLSPLTEGLLDKCAEKVTLRPRLS